MEIALLYSKMTYKNTIFNFLKSKVLSYYTVKKLLAEFDRIFQILKKNLTKSANILSEASRKFGKY